jgi:hypothetical protein
VTWTREDFRVSRLFQIHRARSDPVGEKWIVEPELDLPFGRFVPKDVLVPEGFERSMYRRRGRANRSDHRGG